MIAWVPLLVKELGTLCKATYIMPVADFNPNTTSTQVFNPKQTKFEFSILYEKGTSEG